MKAKIQLGTLLIASGTLLPSFSQTQEANNLPDDYLKNLKNYKFINTRGMRDLAPNRISWIEDGYEDPDKWEMPTDEERAKLKEMGIEFPDFSFIQGTDTVAPGQKRQRTHTVEHIVYAVPGDAISLYPYYGLEDTFNYFDAFNHWYDYRNGGRLKHTGKDGKEYDLLDFPADRGYMQITNDYGFYGGLYMSPGTTQDPDHSASGTVYKVATPQEYINAVNAINNSGGKGELRLTADLDFASYPGVPMLGDNESHRFSGILNGQGHQIKNLTITGNENVGIIGWADNGARVYNLVVDSSCLFEGKENIGLVGRLYQGGLTVRSVVMNATVRSNNDGINEPWASAILGKCDNGGDNHLTFKDIYIGGVVGKPELGVKYNTALCAWLKTEDSTTHTYFENIIVNGTINGPEQLDGARYIRRNINDGMSFNTVGNSVEERHPNYSIHYINCYTSIPDGGLTDNGWSYRDFSTDGFPTLEGWTGLKPGLFDISTLPSENYGAQILNNRDHRTWDNGDNRPDHQARRRAGTRGVFYFPDSDNLANEWMTDESIQTNNNGIKEYVVAADFSQTFEPDSHLDTELMTVTEPVLAFRHIFRIRDGREQAKELYNNNNDYVRRHQHKVTARVGVDFQIRLDFPLPTDWGRSGGVTNYYYQTGEEYHRVRQFEMRVFDEQRNRLDGEQEFKLGANIKMHRAAPADSHRYAFDDGSKDYHTMLMHDKFSGEAHYVVQIVAKDDAGNVIPTADGNDMVLMEYDITFLPEKGASIVTEKELYNVDKNNNDKYRHARDEYMKDKYGDPSDKIDFDEYILLNKLTDETLRKKMISFSVSQHVENKEWVFKDFPVYKEQSAYKGPGGSNGSKMYHSFYKWPIRWSRSSYTFGYNYRGDYNMYMLATHSENVPYHAKADEWTDNIDGENGLYDRLYYKTRRQNPKAIRQGYFYYVNAATDPGVSARLNFKIDCPGSRVIVSAWVAEMSPKVNENDQPANLSFNFVAVMKGTQERVTLHNFVTGYLDDSQLGQWLNVYYSFVPRLAEFYNDTKKFEDVDHFELELAHNGTSSAGSDYAIDDIRAYVVPPFAEADHEGYACDDSALDISVQTSFETLLEKVGLPESFDENDTEKLSLYYAFVDKEKYDAGASVDEAIVKVVANGNELLPYGMLKFNNNYNKNDRYIDANPILTNKAYRYTAESGERIVRFLTQAAAGTLHLGKEYYVVFKSSVAPEDVPEPGNYASFFDLSDKCSYNCAMVVKPSLKFKFDGVIESEFDNITICENQSPVIQVNVWSTDKEPVEVVKNAWFDWFDGTINEFENYRFKDYPASFETLTVDDGSSHPFNLKQALRVFRSHFPEAESVVGLSPISAIDETKEDLEQWMLDLIDVASMPTSSGRQRLMLHQTSFVLPPVNLPEDAGTAKAKVVAIPIVDLFPTGDYKQVCSSPTELGVKIGNRTPVLQHGLSAIAYPDDLYDVPLRVGLKQLSKDGGLSVSFSKNQVNMPVRKALSSDGKDRVFSKMKEEVMFEKSKVMKEGAIILAQTNDPDPEYRNLGTVNDENEETEALLWVGEIKELHATGGSEDASGTGERAWFVADFDKNFRFKEGYYYRMRFSFEETSDDDPEADSETVCSGQDTFTLKIVPEYMKWTGEKNLSWDNDDNWRRVSASDLQKDKNVSLAPANFTDGKVEGKQVNGNNRGYAPLDFSKIIIDRPVITQNESDNTFVVKGENPYLYSPKDETTITDDYTGLLTNAWTSDPTHEKKSDEMNNVGDPTPLIQFDMKAILSGKATLPENEREAETEKEIRCKPWVANSCSDIHFLPGGTIMNQQALNYDRAWVDMELDHSRWYILSTPLQDIYAGDFYIPSDNGRQETEIFQEIFYNPDLNNRFSPAVYQRGWDKSEAKVVEFGKDSRNVAVKTFWSRVYNDVSEKYGEGRAFSIKTDVSKLGLTEEDKVLFRLPKADNSYLYYSADNSQIDDQTTLDKNNSHRLNMIDENGEFTITTTAVSGKYFIAGNPFMTYLDIQKFLEANEDALAGKYWIITEAGQIAGTFEEGSAYVAYPSTDFPEDVTAIAPMQGFFIEAKDPEATSLTLTYSTDMMRRYASDETQNILHEPTRGHDSAAQLKIMAFNDNKPSSTAILIAGREADSVEAIDNRDLGISSTVFTARKGRALSINFSDELEGSEIGVIADEDTRTILRFEGTDDFEGFYLVDAVENSATPLSELTELEVTGCVANRFFLTKAATESVSAENLKWRTVENILTVTDMGATGKLEVSVFDTLGRLLSSRNTGSDSLSVNLGKGIFMVKMRNANEEKIVKISL